MMNESLSVRPRIGVPRARPTAPEAISFGSASDPSYSLARHRRQIGIGLVRERTRKETKIFSRLNRRAGSRRFGAPNKAGGYSWPSQGRSFQRRRSQPKDDGRTLNRPTYAFLPGRLRSNGPSPRGVNLWGRSSVEPACVAAIVRSTPPASRESPISSKFNELFDQLRPYPQFLLGLIIDKVRPSKVKRPEGSRFQELAKRGLKSQKVRRPTLRGISIRMASMSPSPNGVADQ